MKEPTNFFTAIRSSGPNNNDTNQTIDVVRLKKKK